MRTRIKRSHLFKRLTRNALYLRLRQYFPTQPLGIHDDSAALGFQADDVTLPWPASVRKPRVGVIQDTTYSTSDPSWWTKLVRFLKHNSIPYEFYDLTSAAWLEHAASFDAIVGLQSGQPFLVDQARRKVYVLEHHLHKHCYPSFRELTLYEDKILEAYLSTVHGFPFARTHVFNSQAEALAVAPTLAYPLVSKIVPGSGSIGVELVPSPARCRTIINDAFSRKGRATHLRYARQKNYVYLQEFIPNDGYDLRILVIANRVFGYYRKVLDGDFRASGMGLVEKRDVPIEAMRLARRVNAVLAFPMLVVDMVHGLDGRFHIVEMSPICRIETPEQLHVNGQPGAYVFAPDDTCVFEPCRYWVHELALREFFSRHFLDGTQSAHSA